MGTRVELHRQVSQQVFNFSAAIVARLLQSRCTVHSGCHIALSVWAATTRQLPERCLAAACDEVNAWRPTRARDDSGSSAVRMSLKEMRGAAERWRDDVPYQAYLPPPTVGVPLAPLPSHQSNSRTVELDSKFHPREHNKISVHANPY